MRALVVSNMRPTPERPGRGSFVREQVAALRRIDGLEVELVEGLPGIRGYAALARDLRGARGFDVVHAHFGLTAWPALAVRGAKRVVTLHGTDVFHPRSRRITFAALGRYDLVAAASEDLASAVPVRLGPVVVLPTGVAMHRFGQTPRAEARERLGLPPGEPALMFAHDPARPLKRFDRARQLAGSTRLLNLGNVAPDEVRFHINACNAVLVPSDAEGFGLAVLEALACDVPVLATPVGNHPAALHGIEGTLCAPYDPATWRTVLEPHLAAADPRVEGRRRAEQWSSDAMAARVADAWRGLLEPG